MPLTIGSNIASLMAQRRLGQTTSALESVFERLSSGQRINRASDDAAGLAIANSLRSDARVYGQAYRNINDGISLLNISSSALSSISGIIQRIKELAEQSANGVYASKQREALDDEAQALRQEYNRILQTTEFNGLNLLDGSVENLSIQVGLDSGRNSQISISTGSPLSAVWDGTFTEIGSYSFSSRVAETLVADLNNDGHLDVIASGDSIAISIFFGNGDGTFDAAVTYPGGSNDLMLGDVDNDNDIDIFADNAGQYKILTNNGSGSFSTTSIGATGSFNVGQTFADLDGDGNQDILMVRADDSTYARLGNGDGSFDAPIIQALGVDVSHANYADVNEDGNLDLIYGRMSQPEVYIALGNGDGTFAAGSIAFSSAEFSNSVEFADLNNDGHQDIVFASANSSSKAYTRLGNGDGTFGSTITITQDSVTSPNKFYDINEDGNLDLVRAGFNNGELYVYVGNGDGTFQAGTSFASSRPILDDPAFGDFNEDGVIDIAAPTYTGNTFVVFQGGATQDAVMPSFSLLTQADARTALTTMDEVMTEVSSRLAEVGTSMARLQAAAANVQQTREEIIIAESRIQDADIAYESSQLIRLQILQQAAVAVLGQANIQPKLALTLLK